MARACESYKTVSHPVSIPVPPPWSSPYVSSISSKNRWASIALVVAGLTGGGETSAIGRKHSSASTWKPLCARPNGWSSDTLSGSSSRRCHDSTGPGPWVFDAGVQCLGVVFAVGPGRFPVRPSARFAWHSQLEVFIVVIVVEKVVGGISGRDRNSLGSIVEPPR